MFSKDPECIYPEIHFGKSKDPNSTYYNFQTILRLEKNNNVHILKVKFKHVIDNNQLFETIHTDETITTKLLLHFIKEVYKHQILHEPQMNTLALNQNTEKERLMHDDPVLRKLNSSNINYSRNYNVKQNESNSI